MRRNKAKVVQLIAGATAMTIMSQFSKATQTAYTWQGGVDNNWFTAGNWNPNGIDSKDTFTTLAGETVPFPEGWNPAVVRETIQIGEKIFLKELS